MTIEHMSGLTDGLGATMVIEPSSDSRVGERSVKITRNGGNCMILQKIRSNKPIDHFKTMTLTVSCWVKCDSAQRARFYFYDGVRTTESGTHSGSGEWELLTVRHTVDENATGLEMKCYVIIEDCSAFFDGAVIVETSPHTDTQNLIFNGDFEHWNESKNHQARYVSEYDVKGNYVSTCEYYSDGVLVRKLQGGAPAYPYFIHKEEEFSFEIRDASDQVISMGSKDGHIRLPVYTGLRRGGGDYAYFLIVRGVPFAEFRDKLIKSKIIEEQLSEENFNLEGTIR